MSTDSTMSMRMPFPRVDARGQPQHADASARHAMRNVFILVGVAIAVFMAFTAYSIHMAAHERQQLAAIKDLYFPVLQHADADLIRIDKMEEQYLESVQLGERENLGNAHRLGVAAQADLAAIATMYPDRAAEVAALRRELDRYQELAERNATAFLDHAAMDGSVGVAMNLALAALRRDLQGFRQASYRSFTATLADTQTDANSGSVLGLALGAMNLCFMSVLVYLIRNNMRMMTVIAEQNTTLELRVAQRTAELSRKNADINAMLQNMKLGVATVVPGNRIHPEYSAYFRTIVDLPDLADRDVLDAVFGRSSLGIDSKDQVSAALAAILGENVMMFDFNGHLLPRETTISTADGGEKMVQLEWNPIRNEQDIVEKMLLIAQDVTDLRHLQSLSSKQKQELDIIANILRAPPGRFNDVMASTQNFLEQNRRLIGSAARGDAETVAALFRNMHSIKGNARTFGFTQITDAAHLAEQEYDRLRRDDAAVWDPMSLLASLATVEDAVARYIAINEDTLGRKGRAADFLTSRGAFVDNEELAALRALAAQLGAQDPGARESRLRQAIDGLGYVNLSRLLSGADDYLASIARDVGKPKPVIELIGPELAVSTPFAETLKLCAMHLFRNALDHGIESPEERARLRKPAQGTLRIESVFLGDAAEIRIGDDGQGLALQRLLDKAVAENLIARDAAPSRDVVAELIFRAGMTTATRLTELSGRGVGLDAVRTFLREHDATIRVELRDSRPATGFDAAPFDFVIRVPHSCCKFSETPPPRS